MSNKPKESLSKVNLLADLSQAELARLAKSCSFKRYGAHEQIIDRQSETTDVFFVIDGNVRVVNYSLSGREITLDDLDAGAYFGELAAIDGRPRSASVMALSDCLVASLPQEQFLALLEKNPKTSFKVMRTLARIVRTATDRIMDLSTLAANNRVHADLLRLARGHMAGKNRAEIAPIPNHSDIASRASTTRETVARVLSDLARNGLVERQKDSLVIHNVQRLSDMVEEVRGDYPRTPLPRLALPGPRPNRPPAPPPRVSAASDRGHSRCGRNGAASSPSLAPAPPEGGRRPARISCGAPEPEKREREDDDVESLRGRRDPDVPVAGADAGRVGFHRQLIGDGRGGTVSSLFRRRESGPKEAFASMRSARRHIRLTRLG